MPDVRPETQQAIAKQLESIGERLATINASGLAEDAALNHQLLTRRRRDPRRSNSHSTCRAFPSENDSGFHTLLDYLARTTAIGSREDAEAWIARLEATPAYYEQNLANLQRGIKTKYTQPRIVADRVLEGGSQTGEHQGRKTARCCCHSSACLRAFRRRRKRNIARRRSRSCVIAFCRRRRSSPTSWKRNISVPPVPSSRGGRCPTASSYKFFVRRETTTQMTPDEIHQLGQSEVTRIRGLMEKTIAETGFKGSFADFLKMLRTDPRFYAKTPEELMEKASEIAKRSDDRLPRLFGTLPRLSYGVRPVPADIAEGYTTGRYWGGSMQLGQAGGYMVNTSHLDQRPLYELPALTVHEAVPGHHLQIALSQELSDIPYFRRNTSPTAFTEGWGLYSEFLGEEMGIYRDPTSASAATPTRCGGPAASSPTPAFTGWAGTSSRRVAASPRTRRSRPQHPDRAGALHLLAGPGAGVQDRRAAFPWPA